MRLTSFAGHFFPFLCVLCGKVVKKSPPMPRVVYEPFDPADFVQNPVALARMRAGVKQVELAKRMDVSQAYVSKLEHADTISEKALKRVQEALKA